MSEPVRPIAVLGDPYRIVRQPGARGRGARRRRGGSGPSIAAIAAAVGLLLPASTHAQTIRGLLLESGRQTPIDLGEVMMLGEDGDTVAAALSNEDGFFSLTAPEPGTYRVVATALGHLGRGAGPFELEEGSMQVVQLLMEAAPVPIEGVDVVTRPVVVTDDVLLANGFYERMMTGRGEFLTPEDVANSNARWTVHLLRDLSKIRPQYGAPGWRIWPRIWSPTGAGGCTPRVWIDDVWVNQPGHQQFNPGMGLEDVVSRDEVRAIELFWGLQGPLRYRATNRPMEPICGVLLVWTKNPGR